MDDAGRVELERRVAERLLAAYNDGGKFGTIADSSVLGWLAVAREALAMIQAAREAMERE